MIVGQEQDYLLQSIVSNTNTRKSINHFNYGLFQISHFTATCSFSLFMPIAFDIQSSGSAADKQVSLSACGFPWPHYDLSTVFIVNMGNYILIDYTYSNQIPQLTIHMHMNIFQIFHIHESTGMICRYAKLEANTIERSLCNDNNENISEYGLY